MDINQLKQKHEKEWQEVLQKQRQEKNALDNRIAQAKQILSVLTGALDRREKENEIAQLQQQHDTLIKGYEQQSAQIKLRHQCEPIVVKLLEEAVHKAGLQRSNESAYEEYYRKPYIKETGWIFTKKVTEYKDVKRAVKKNLKIPLDVVEEQSGKWVTGGKLADNSGYFMVIHVHLGNNGYGVFAESINKNGDIQYRNHSYETRGLTEMDLADVLLNVIKGFQLVAPACACDCACQCDCSNDCGCPETIPSYAEADISKLSLSLPSPELRVVQGVNSAVVYHSLFGNLRMADIRVVEFFDMLRQNPDVSLPELQAHFSGFDLAAEVAEMRRLGFLQTENMALHWGARREKANYQNGELIRSLRLNLSTSCNLACTYCHGFNDADDGLIPCIEGKDSANQMSLDLALRSIRVYADLMMENNQTHLQIRYFGGEPLLNWQVLLKSMAFAVELAAKNGLEVELLLNTNATTLTSAMAKQLSYYKAFLSVMVSVDGPQQAHDTARHFRNGHGSFDLALRGLRLLRQESIPVTASITLGEHNKAYLHALIDILIENDVFILGVGPIKTIENNGNLTELAHAILNAAVYGQQKGFRVSGFWDIFSQRIERGANGAYCGGSGNEISVIPFGEIYPCQAQPLKLGTLDDVQSRAMFKTEIYKKIVLRVAGSLPKCRGCDFEGMCGGGCLADAYMVNGDIYEPTQYCEFMKVIGKDFLKQKLLQENYSMEMASAEMYAEKG